MPIKCKAISSISRGRARNQLEVVQRFAFRGFLRERKGLNGTAGDEKVVVAGDDDVGDFIEFGKGFFGLFQIPAIGKNLACGKMGGGGDGIAGNNGGESGFADDQATLAGRVTGERVDLQAVGEFVGGGLDAVKEGTLFFDEGVEFLFAAMGGLFFGLVEGGADGGNFGFVHPPSGFWEVLEGAAMDGTPVG